MRKNFNFKAEWAVAIQMLRADLRLCIYQIILTMGLNDVSLEEAIAENGAAISDSEAINLLINVEKVLARRRRARERAAARRLARAAAGNNPENNTNPEHTTSHGNSGHTPAVETRETEIHGATAVTDAAPPSDSAKNTGPAPNTPRRRRHKHKKRKSRNQQK